MPGARLAHLEAPYVVKRDGATIDVRCPVHGTRVEMASKHPDE